MSEKFTHTGKLYGIPVYYNIETCDTEVMYTGTGWILEIAIFIALNIRNDEGFIVKDLKRIE